MKDNTHWLFTTNEEKDYYQITPLYLQSTQLQYELYREYNMPLLTFEISGGNSITEEDIQKYMIF